MRFSGAVLTGGASTRMGTDKAFLAVPGDAQRRPLARIAVDALRAAGASEVLAVGGDPDRLRAEIDPALRTVADGWPGQGPLGGITTALAAAREPIVVVLACDLPFLSTDHLRMLIAAADAAAATRRGPNPLLAAYRRAPLAERAAGLGPGDPASRLLPPDVAVVDLGPATFNVNRPQDLEVADLLVDHPDHVIATTQWLRELIAAAVPDAEERVYTGGHSIGYRNPRAGLACVLFPGADTVQLSFEHGARLPDPRGLLSGSGRQVRSVEVTGPGDPPGTHLLELIEAAIDG